MKLEKFEYRNKDVPIIKKDTAFRMLFVGLFLLVFIWQLAFMIRDFSLGTLTTIKSIVAVIVLIVSLVFILVAFSYAYRSISILSDIKHYGKSVKTLTVLSDNRRGSFVRMYSLLTKFITLIMVLALLSGLTYGILEYSYFHTISFYLPIMFFVAVSGLNSVYHISTEIKVMQEVEKYTYF